MEKYFDQVAREIARQLGAPPRISLNDALLLLRTVEEESRRMDQASVAAVCGADGNMIAIHNMDGALLVSFDAAAKKAYTAAALRVPTRDLTALAAPGGELYGLDRLDHGRIVVIGGGVPLLRNGTIVGALGISGGTAQQDHTLAAFGAAYFERMSCHE